MSAGWLAHNWGYEESMKTHRLVISTNTEGLIMCKADGCMAYENGKCNLMSKPNLPITPFLRSKDIKGKQDD
jgi:hypothetical protein